MQDRFKFRVWSVEQEKMYYWSDCIKGGTNFIYGMFLDHRMLGKGLWYIQQCTGLKDKNGKLIYEGDVVRLFGNIEGQNINNIHSVKFGDFAMYVYGWYLGGIEYAIPLSTSLDTSGLELEIIGNIYENADLLRGEE